MEYDITNINTITNRDQECQKLTSMCLDCQIFDYKPISQEEILKTREISEIGSIGFKATNYDLCCMNDFQFTLERWYTHEGEIKPCKSGFHLCKRLRDVYNYYFRDSDRYFIIEYKGKTIEHGNKTVASEIKLVREIHPDLITEDDITSLRTLQQTPAKCIWCTSRIKRMLENHYINNCLYISIRHNVPCLRDIERMMTYGADPTIFNYELIETLIKMNNTFIIKALIEKGISMTFNNNFAIKHACQWGYELMVKYLIDYGNVDINVDEGVPLVLAAINGNYMIVVNLIEHGAIGGSLALKAARQNRRENVVLYLTNHGIKEEIKDI